MCQPLLKSLHPNFPASTYQAFRDFDWCRSNTSANPFIGSHSIVNPAVLEVLCQHSAEQTNASRKSIRNLLAFSVSTYTNIARLRYHLALLCIKWRKPTMCSLDVGSPKIGGIIPCHSWPREIGMCILLNATTRLGAHCLPNTGYTLNDAGTAHDAGSCNQEFAP